MIRCYIRENNSFVDSIGLFFESAKSLYDDSKISYSDSKISSNDLSLYFDHLCNNILNDIKFNFKNNMFINDKIYIMDHYNSYMIHYSRCDVMHRDFSDILRGLVSIRFRSTSGIIVIGMSIC